VCLGASGQESLQEVSLICTRQLQPVGQTRHISSGSAQFHVAQISCHRNVELFGPLAGSCVISGCRVGCPELFYLLSSQVLR
jgi:hypothetical protein